MDANHDQIESCARQWATIAQLLTLSSRKMRRVFGQCASAHDISETQFLVLFACGRHAEGLCQSALAEQTGLSAAQVSGLVDQLERQALIEVVRSPIDRRRRLCRLASRGHEQLSRILYQVAPLTQRLHDHIGSAARDELRQTLQSLLGMSNRPHGGEESGSEKPDTPMACQVGEEGELSGRSATCKAGSTREASPSQRAA